MTNENPSVLLQGVTRRFGDLTALNRVDLRIEAGETVALLGPNGAGKSTAINLMLGLIRPDAGRVELFGRRPGQAVEAGRVGSMLQDTMYLPNATVREFVELARALYPRRAKVDDILAMAGLTDRAGGKLDKLSGGEAKRARFAFALAGDPDLLVLDEPTAAMDVAGRQQFWATMRDWSAGDRTVLFATHHMNEVEQYADRVIVIARGRVVADGPTTEVMALASGRTVSFDLCGAPSDGLRDLPRVRDMEIRADRVSIGTDDADALVTALVQSGRPFANLEIHSAGLEEAFITLTAGA
jgi:ABC-2 type transport system ATP-binding protein